jgi:hypothetical protein
MRWAWAAGIEVPDGPLDDMIIELYLDRDQHRVEPEAETDVVDLTSSAPPAITADTVIAPPRPVPAPMPELFGPQPCLSCGGPGYLDHVDLVRRTQTQRCRFCQTSWVTALD